MRGIATFALIAGLTLTAQSAAAESWSRFSATDRIAYLVDLDQLNAVALNQVVVRRSDVRHGLASTEHQIGQRAGDETGIGLDQGHLDAVVGPHADVFGRGSARVATADDDNLGAIASANTGTACDQTHGANCGSRL